MPRFRSKPAEPIEIEAFQLGCAVNVLLGRGKPHLHGQKGDWLATHADGSQEILTAKQLDDRFEPVEAAAPALIRRNGKRKTRPKAQAAKPKHKRRARATPATWAEARQLFESGTDVATIAKRLDVTIAALYYHSAKEGWKRPKAPKAAAGEQLPGKVRCPHCKLWTDRDPCSSCGKKVRK
jgi:hypothetical protein